VEKIEQQVATIPGLAVAGAALRGVGVPDVLAQGEAAAAGVLGRPALAEAAVGP
jgi:oxygen-dependent protoporphyrinogen oxidase